MKMTLELMTALRDAQNSKYDLMRQEQKLRDEHAHNADELSKDFSTLRNMTAYALDCFQYDRELTNEQMAKEFGVFFVHMTNETVGEK